MANEKLTAQQRAALFAQATRQNFQMLPAEKATGGSTTLSFQFPKSRLLSKVMLKCNALIKIKHASITNVPFDGFTPFKVLRKITMDLNNGFSPYVIGGKEAAMLNMIHIHPGVMTRNSNNEQAYVYMPDLKASTEGTTNVISFNLELPVALNDRDPVGLILLQNDQTNVTLMCDIAAGADILDYATGYTVEVEQVVIQPMLETFSIPAVADAYPDLSVLKLTNSRVDSYVGSGQNIIKLATGTIYRRLVFQILDDNGNPLNDSQITSDISLIFNQADANYNISPAALRALNTRMLGYELPKGMFVFDFANQGLTGLSGTRDYIDTNRLTEFWLRFSTVGKGKIIIISECLARLA